MLNEFSDLLVKYNALSFGEFTLSSGKSAPYYFDLRILASFHDSYALCINAYKMIINEIGLDKIGALVGVPTAGLIFASPLAFLLKKPLLYVREEEKGHGKMRRVEGLVRRGESVIIIDDVITTGKSMANCIEVLREMYSVNHAVVLIDRMEGGRERLIQLGVKLHSFTDVREIFNILRSKGIISDKFYDSLLLYLRR